VFVERFEFVGWWFNQRAAARATVSPLVALHASHLARFAVRRTALTQLGRLVVVVENEVNAIAAEISFAYLAPRLSVRAGIGLEVATMRLTHASMAPVTTQVRFRKAFFAVPTTTIYTLFGPDTVTFAPILTSARIICLSLV
jgi:hypothetical protein